MTGRSSPVGRQRPRGSGLHRTFAGTGGVATDRRKTPTPVARRVVASVGFDSRRRAYLSKAEV